MLPVRLHAPPPDLALVGPGSGGNTGGQLQLQLGLGRAAASPGGASGCNHAHAHCHHHVRAGARRVLPYTWDNWQDPGTPLVL